MQMPNSDNKQRGSSLIMVVLLTFVLSIMAASMLQLALEGYSQSTRDVQKERAYRVAEAGLLAYQRIWSELVEIRNYSLDSSHREELIRQLNEKVIVLGRNPELKMTSNEDGSETISSYGSLGWFKQDITLNAREGKGAFGKAVVSAVKKLPDSMTTGSIVTQNGSAPSVALRASDLALGLRASSFSKELNVLYEALHTVHPLPSPVVSQLSGVAQMVDLNPMVPSTASIQVANSLTMKLDCSTTICTVNGDVRVGGNLVIECAGICSGGQLLSVRGSIIVNGSIVSDVPFSVLNIEGGLASGGSLKMNRAVSGQVAQAIIVAGDLQATEWRNVVVANDLVVGGNLRMNRLEDVQIYGVWLNSKNVLIDEMNQVVAHSAIATAGDFEVALIRGSGFEVNGTSTRLAEGWKHLNGLVLAKGNIILGRAQGNSLSALNIKGFLMSNANIQIQGFSSNADIQLGGLAAKDGFSLGDGPWRNGLITIRLNQPDPNQAQNGQVRYEIDYDSTWKSDWQIRQ